MVLSEGQADMIARMRSISVERDRYVDSYLEGKGDRSIGELTMKEAKELIDELSRITEGVRIEHYLTHNQMIYVDQLQDTAPRRNYTAEFLKMRDKKSIDSLSTSEASELIAVLKSMRPPSEGEKLDAPITLKQMEKIHEFQDTEERRAVTERFLGEVLSKGLLQLTRQEADELISMLE